MKFKVAIRPKPVRSDGTIQVKIRVCHDDKTRYIGTDYYVLPKYFDKTTGMIKAGGEYTQEKADRANTKLQIRIGSMAEKMVNLKHHPDIKSLLVLLRDRRDIIDMYALMDDKIRKYEKLGNLNYRDSIRSTKVLIEKFNGPGILSFETVNHAWLMKLENWMRFRDMKPNGIGVRMRNIRTLYNQAITMGYVDLASYPFRKYKIPKEATRKRNITAEELSAIARVEIKDPLMEWSRSIFMLSFYLIGINLKDLFYLTGIEDGRIYYIRSKGKKPYSIKVWSEAKEIIDRYPGKKYLLNTLEKYPDYRSATTRINKKLKDIAALCKINKEISTYYARHSWATIASSLGVPKDVIAYALGHSFGSDMTTIYVDFDLRKVDDTNRMILDHVFKTPLSGQSPSQETDVVCVLDQ